MNTLPLPSRRQPRGLTLMELLIVLAILATLTIVGSVATENLLAERRYELTRGTMTDVQTAVLGPATASGSTATSAVMGFVADLGRPPVAVGSEPGTQLAELWSNPANLAPFSVQTSPLDPEVSLACGWRGPYLRLPIDANTFADGWGRPFAILTLDSSGYRAAASGEVICALASYGADGEVGIRPGMTNNFPQDLLLRFDDGQSVNPQTLWQAGLRVTVFERSDLGDRIAPEGGGNILVRVFGADPNTGTVGVTPAPVATGPFTAPPVFVVGDLAIGPKVLRAYHQLADGRLRTSIPLSIDLARTGQANFELLLPPPPPVAEPEPPVDP